MREQSWVERTVRWLASGSARNTPESSIHGYMSLLGMGEDGVPVEWGPLPVPVAFAPFTLSGRSLVTRDDGFDVTEEEAMDLMERAQDEADALMAQWETLPQARTSATAWRDN